MKVFIFSFYITGFFSTPENKMFGDKWSNFSKAGMDATPVA